ncbi:MAG: TonB-dependent receptor domain-containing protein [Terracidiphilus sp.]
MGRDRSAAVWLRKFGYLTLTFSFFCVVASQQAFAQVDEGSISGTIQDTTGAVVPGALVTLLNTDQGMTLQTTSSPTGVYTFSPVRIGHYKISATARGFSKTTQDNVTVNVAQSLLVNIQLKLGAATETIEVSTAPPLLQTEEASVGQVIGTETVNNLPLNGRNFTFLAQLGAGMNTPQADTRGNAASGAFSANGLRPAQNNYLLDGIDNNSNAVDFLNGTNFVILPPLDAIQEFKVQTADFSAELGRAAGAVLNATIKSGTNSFHGAAWEFFRNDKLDAADWFEDNSTTPVKGELRLNQFGASAGGPIIKNKIFFFGDYEGKRRVQGTSFTSSVPTALEQSSTFTNFTDVLTQAGGSTRQDGLGRSIQAGTILDPASTRFVPNGTMDPVSGLTNSSGQDVYVRDPISSTCGPSTKIVTLAACPDLNQLPSARLDPNAVKLLQLFPKPNSGLATYQDSPALYEHSNTFDVRGDINPNEKEQIFVRVSYADDPQFIPGPFAGVADGGAFQQGLQTAKSLQGVAGWTHVFTPNTINQARLGVAHLHTTRYGPVGSQSGIPAQYGIADIQQVAENGGLPDFYISGLTNLGSNNFLPSDEVSYTIQATDDFTKIYGRHSFKMGIEYQHVKFSTLQPAWSRGAFNFTGGFADIPNQSETTTGMPEMLLPPTAFSAKGGAYTTANDPNGFSFSGGSNGVYASNINKTYDEKIYFASYLQDDWKMNPKLTLNLGVRWDYFGPINETNGGQANFVPIALPEKNIGAPTFIVPASGKDNRTLSTSSTCTGIGCVGVVDQLAEDGITLYETNRYGQGLLQTQKTNFAPRIGLAYAATPKLVARGGLGLFFNSFENQGYGPNIGENYPFVFNLSYFPTADPSQPSEEGQVAPIHYNSPYAGCASAGPGGTASLESGFSCIPLSPAAVNAQGLGLQGLQFDYSTPRTYSANLTLQYSLTHTLSAQASYVFTDGQDLQGGVGYQNVTEILPAGISTGKGCPYATFPENSCHPFPDFGGGSYQATYGHSQYNGLQTKLEQQNWNGLSYLLTYTWSKTMSNAGDLLNGGNTGSLRAYAVPGLGPKFDIAPADFDIRNVIHFSGGYQLPFGKDKRYLNQGGAANMILGGWSTNWILTLQGGQPLNFGCPTGSTSGTNCNDVLVSGQHTNLGVKDLTDGGGYHGPHWIGNIGNYTIPTPTVGAFSQPCKLGVSSPGAPLSTLAPITGSATNCVALNGSDALGSKAGQIVTPGFHRLDFSLFKGFQLNERFSLQFRAEFFNIANHPNFNAPNFGGNGVVSVSGSGTYTNPSFGAIGSTRDAPFDPRQIQFALKLYY